jgi:hypothetical protein
MIDHSFAGDWRHVAWPLVLTVVVAGIVVPMAFSLQS